MTKTSKQFVKFISLVGLLGAVVFGGRYFGLHELIDPATVRAYASSFGILAPIVFMVVYAGATILFLPGSPLTVAGGALFGPVWGTLYVIVGASLGATVAFLFSRYFGREFVERLLRSRFSRLDRYDRGLKEHGLAVMLFFRLVPLFPFNGLNFALGLTRVSVRNYILGTVIGIIPGAFAYAYLGNALVVLNVFQITVAVGIFVILFVLIVAYRRMFRALGRYEYDIIVIGAGAAGLNIASFMNKAGFKVLLVEKDEDAIGGDCLNAGCIPSKALIRVARQVKEARETGEFGLDVSGAVNMKAVRAYIRGRQEIIRRHENAEHLRRQGMHVVIGMASFTGRDTISVGGHVYTAKKFVLATGSRPRVFSVPGVEMVETVHTNETIFDLDSLPRRLLVVGGGPVGIEISQAFACLGSEVTVVHRGERILEHDDPDVTSVLAEQLDQDGVCVYTNSELGRFVSSNEARIERAGADDISVQFDVVFAAIGREVVTDGLELERAGVEIDDRGHIIHDDYLRTTNKRVLLCGDVVGGLQFTHATELHAKIILNNFFSFWPKRLSTDSFAWVIYTQPEVATFGLSEMQLRGRGISYEVIESDFSRDDRAIIDGYRNAKIKLFVQRGRLLGGTIVAPGAGEIIQELILANHLAIPLRRVFGKTYPYPTATRINRQVLGMYYGKRLRGFLKTVLKALYH